MDVVCFPTVVVNFSNFFESISSIIRLDRIKIVLKMTASVKCPWAGCLEGLIVFHLSLLLQLITHNTMHMKSFHPIQHLPSLELG